MFLGVGNQRACWLVVVLFGREASNFRRWSCKCISGIGGDEAEAASSWTVFCKHVREGKQARRNEGGYPHLGEISNKTHSRTRKLLAPPGS